MADSAMAVSRWHCPSCDDDVIGGVRVRVDEVTSGERGVLIAEGEGQVAHPHCPRCGAVTKEIVTAMPAELEGSPCPTCGRSGTFEYRVSAVQLGDGQFQFTVRAACRRCEHQNVFQRMVATLLRIRKVRVGPGGFEIEIAA